MGYGLFLDRTVEFPDMGSNLFLQAFGQSFLQPDIHIFKQNLSYLESLNSKHKLYHRVSSALICHTISS